MGLGRGSGKAKKGPTSGIDPNTKFRSPGTSNRTTARCAQRAAAGQPRRREPAGVTKQTWPRSTPGSPTAPRPAREGATKVVTVFAVVRLGDTGGAGQPVHAPARYHRARGAGEGPGRGPSYRIEAPWPLGGVAPRRHSSRFTARRIRPVSGSFHPPPGRHDVPEGTGLHGRHEVSPDLGREARVAVRSARGDELSLRRGPEPASSTEARHAAVTTIPRSREGRRGRSPLQHVTGLPPHGVTVPITVRPAYRHWSVGFGTHRARALVTGRRPLARETMRRS